jgi:hypothetical protein
MRCRADADAKNVHDGHHPGEIEDGGGGGGGGGGADGSRPPLSCLDVNETRGGGGGGGGGSESGWDDRARVATRTLRKIAEVADAGFCAANSTRTYAKAELEREAREMKLKREKTHGEGERGGGREEAAEDAAAVVVCPPVDAQVSREDDEDDEDDEDEEALATAIARLELTLDPWWITTRTVFANAYDVSQWETRLAAPPGNEARSIITPVPIRPRPRGARRSLRT